MDMIEKAARALAHAMGDDFDHAFANKSEWNAARGEKGGRYRDINEPMQHDYLAGARMVLETVRDADARMIAEGESAASLGIGRPVDDAALPRVWHAMIDAALSPPSTKE